MKTTDGKELEEAVVGEGSMPNNETLEKLMEQGKAVYTGIYEFFCDYVYKQEKDISRMTKEEFNQVVFTFMTELPHTLNKHYIEIYKAFLEPYLKSDEDLNMIYTYIGNLYLQPLVIKVATEFIEKRQIDFRKPNNGFREVLN